MIDFVVGIPLGVAGGVALARLMRWGVLAGMRWLILPDLLYVVGHLPDRDFMPHMASLEIKEAKDKDGLAELLVLNLRFGLIEHSGQSYRKAFLFHALKEKYGRRRRTFEPSPDNKWRTRCLWWGAKVIRRLLFMSGMKE